MAADPLIRATGLAKIFGTTRVLNGVALDVHGGEAVALLGSNGAGKTTLLRILATLSRPSKGTATIAGHDCVQDAEGVRRNIAFVAHGAHVYENLTALENLTFWMALGGGPTKRSALTGALAAVELDAYANERVRTFSVGMKRRLAFAGLVLRRPRVLLLDEPSAGLDQRAWKWVEEHLRSFREAGGAVMMTTHSFGRGLDVADRIAILAGGRIVYDAARAGLGPVELQRLYAMHTEEPA